MYGSCISYIIVCTKLNVGLFSCFSSQNVIIVLTAIATSFPVFNNLEHVFAFPV